MRQQPIWMPVLTAVAIGAGLFFLSFILLRIIIAALIIRGGAALIKRHFRTGGWGQGRFNQPAGAGRLTLHSSRVVDID